MLHAELSPIIYLAHVVQHCFFLLYSDLDLKGGGGKGKRGVGLALHLAREIFFSQIIAPWMAAVNSWRSLDKCC